VSFSVGFALRFLFFLKRWKFFKNNFFFWVGIASSIQNFGRVLACAVFNCACKMG
jgi:hypothetical protein